MDYKRFTSCLEILENERKTIFKKEGWIEVKLDCLEDIKNNGKPYHINPLFKFLKGGDIIIRTKVAETITSLYLQLKSQNDLYSNLKNLDIKEGDISYYKKTFSADVYLHLLSIASLNRNGYVRALAIKELALIKNSHAIKFILLRLGDWVIAVRELAQKLIRAFLKEEFTDNFIENFKLVNGLLDTQRVNLSAIHAEIISLILTKDLTDEFYKKIKSFEDKNRLLYFRFLLKSKPEVYPFILKDKNPLIRLELIKNSSLFSEPDKNYIFQKLLQDKSAKVRIAALYEIAAIKSDFESILLNLISDSSASVREFSRHLLKDKFLNFAALYRQRLIQNENLPGNILGLSEVGEKSDLSLFENYIKDSSTRIRIACLIAIQRIDSLVAKKYSLDLLDSQNRSVQYKCMEILCLYKDKEVLEKSRIIYHSGDAQQKIAMLTFFNRIGGWAVVADIIFSLSDKDENVQFIGWFSLQKWKDKAVKLFTKPGITDLQRANENYKLFEETKIKVPPSSEKLWKELLFFIQ